MAIVNLGSNDIFIGQGFYIYSPFAYRSNRAYMIYAEFTSTNFSNLVSFVRIYPYVEPTGGVARLLSSYIDLEILDQTLMFYFPCSTLFNGNGDVSFYVERRSYWTGGGDGETVNLTLSYDDALFTATWR